MNVPVDLFGDWLSNKGLKERSIQNYLYYFNKFTSPRLNQESVSKFLSHKANRNSVSRGFLVNLRNFMLINHKELKIDSYYYKEIGDLQLPKMTGRKVERLVNTLSLKQIDLLEKALPTDELKLMLLVSYYAGLRLGELMKIKINSFNWEQWKGSDSMAMGEIKVFGKGDKEGIAILPREIMVRVAKYIHSKKVSKGTNSFLFDLKHRSWQLYLYKAGVESKITKLDHYNKPIKDTVVHPHKLRHSYGHNLLLKGVDIRYIKEALRHSSIQSTQIYTQLDKEELKDKLNSVF